MKRREFLQWLIGIVLAIISVFLPGCGGGSNSTPTPTSRKVRVNIGDKSKSVDVSAGDTVLDVIKRAYCYERHGNTTTIDNTNGDWRYLVNNIEPDVYADDYQIADIDDTIHLSLI